MLTCSGQPISWTVLHEVHRVQRFSGRRFRDRPVCREGQNEPALPAVQLGLGFELSEQPGWGACARGVASLAIRAWILDPSSSREWCVFGFWMRLLLFPRIWM